MDFNELIGRFASGNFSPQDEKRIAKLMRDGERVTEIEEALRREWETQEESGKSLDHVLYKLHYLINREEGKQTKPRRRMIGRWAVELAAAALLAVGIFFAMNLLFTDRDMPTAIAELQAPLNARVQFTLPDGTTGWLNSGSTLRYPMVFTQNREVELFGEAFFDVEKSADKAPFTVAANGGKVVVLGTRFNVITDDQGLTAEVILEEGKVEFVYGEKSDSRAVAMNPGERLVYDNQRQSHVIELVNPSDYTQWINGRFVIRGESITFFLEQFKRRFNIDVVVGDNRLDNIRFRATFENESPEEILRLLELITPISYTVNDRQLLPDGTFSKRQVIVNYKDKTLNQHDGIYQ